MLGSRGPDCAPSRAEVGWRLLFAVFVATGCSATTVGGKDQEHPVIVSAPVTLGEGNTGKAESARPSATERPESEPRTAAGFLPDPKPLATTLQWELELRLNHGEVKLNEAKRRVFERPVVTSRLMGRFAFELWIGRELIERVRFDFPLLGAEAPARSRQSIDEEPRFGPGLDVRRTILVPDSPRATRAQLTDRATGAVQLFPWPPDDPLDPAEEPEPQPPEPSNEQ